MCANGAGKGEGDGQGRTLTVVLRAGRHRLLLARTTCQDRLALCTVGLIRVRGDAVASCALFNIAAAGNSTQAAIGTLAVALGRWGHRHVLAWIAHLEGVATGLARLRLIIDT